MTDKKSCVAYFAITKDHKVEIFVIIYINHFTVSAIHVTMRCYNLYNQLSISRVSLFSKCSFNSILSNQLVKYIQCSCVIILP